MSRLTSDTVRRALLAALLATSSLTSGPGGALASPAGAPIAAAKAAAIGTHQEVGTRDGLAVEIMVQGPAAARRHRCR